MATKKKAAEAEIAALHSDPAVPHPRLSKLIIKNFRAIGENPVIIDLEDIVVLVGPNNVGKSSILKAYELIMSHGSKECCLSIEDFPNKKVEKDKLPEIELQTIVYDNTPGEKWIKTENGEKCVRERWIWAEDGKQPKRQGFNVETGDWDDQVPWGAPNIANTRRPQPHRVEAFADPLKQADEIVKLLSGVLEDRVKQFRTPKESEGGEQSDYEKLLTKIADLQKTIVSESKAEIAKIEGQISEALNKVFPNYTIQFDARPEENLDKCLKLFETDAKLLMGPNTGYKSSIERQGSGARRTLLWAALRIVAENKNAGKDKGEIRPHVLLLDEPELCLHPAAIRDACATLYELPQSGNWQVMATTHSPAFIDFSRDNTTIIRVERTEHGDIKGTTIFRPKTVSLDPEDKKRLKLLNLCDPYVAEFFFGGKSIIVEGDTEYTAFNHVKEMSPGEFKDIHIIRARGKANIVSLAKILNHFGATYSILHDSDTPKVTGRKNKKELTNPAWTLNERILEIAQKCVCQPKPRIVATLINFEQAFFGESVDNEKPYSALEKMRETPVAYDNIKTLLTALTTGTTKLPDGAVEWKDLPELKGLVEKA
jgi:putative ATP-dependent endonuclease of OLD family